MYSQTRKLHSTSIESTRMLPVSQTSRTIRPQSCSLERCHKGSRMREALTGALGLSSGSVVECKVHIVNTLNCTLLCRCSARCYVKVECCSEKSFVSATGRSCRHWTPALRYQVPVTAVLTARFVPFYVTRTYTRRGNNVVTNSNRANPTSN